MELGDLRELDDLFVEFDDEAAALAFAATDVYGSVLGGDNAMGEIETDADAIIAGELTTIETLEDMRELVFWDAGTVVTDGYLGVERVILVENIDLRSRLRMLD